MSFDSTISNFALFASQNVSSSLKKVITFKFCSSTTLPFQVALAKFRENSFFTILRHDESHAILAIDQAILSHWIEKDFSEIDDTIFESLKTTTQSLCTEFQRLLSEQDDQKWSPIRWETHPNFLAVIPAIGEVTLCELNVHIARQTGKIWLLLAPPRS